MMVLPSTRYDVHTLIAFLRESDLWETRLAAGFAGRRYDLYKDLMNSFGETDYWTVWKDDKLVGMGGIRLTSTCENIGAIWFLGTDLADKYPIDLLRTMRRFIQNNREMWYKFGNIIPAGFDERLRWLRQLGFDFEEIEAQQNGRRVVIFISKPL